jgi:hypothetical protein
MAQTLAGAINGIQSTIIETRNTLIPYLPDGVSFSAVGAQTTPPISRSFMGGTLIAKTNSDLAHSCDFKFTINANTDFNLGVIDNPVTLIKKSIAESRNAAAALIRSLIGQAIDAFRLSIKGIIIALNFDPSGLISSAVSVAKKYIRQINEKLKEVAEYIAAAILYQTLIFQIQEIINFITTLPAKVLALIQECFLNFTNGIKNAAAQVAALPGAVVATAAAAVGGVANQIVGGVVNEVASTVSGVVGTIALASEAALSVINKKVVDANVPASLIAVVNSPSTANVDSLSAYITDTYVNQDVSLNAGFDSANTTPP